MWDKILEALNRYYVLPRMPDSARPRRFAPAAEAARLAALARYEILDTNEEELFNATVRLASSICSSPIASISFIDGGRQWLKARVGYPVSEIPRDLAFCSHTIGEESGHLIIDDASLDARFAEHPFVANAPYIRFYAGASLISEDGHALGTLCVMDKDARKLSNEQIEALKTLAAQVMTQLELRRSNRRLSLLEAAMAQSNDAIMVAALPLGKGAVWTAEFANRALADMSEREMSAIVGQAIDRGGLFDAEMQVPDAYWQALQKGRNGIFEWVRHLESGEIRRFETSVAPLQDASGRVTHSVSVSRDVTERRVAEEAQIRAELLEAAAVDLEYAATHDNLTNLWNRAYVHKRISALLEELRVGGADDAVLMFLDLDRFKVINDSLGHFVGDMILVRTSERLQKILEGKAMLARLGGDEFMILITDVGERLRVEILAEQLLAELSEPFSVVDREIFLSASIGIVFVNASYESPEDVIRDADTAMYRAKAQGKNRYEFFTADLHEKALGLLRLENDLRRAIGRNELTVFYQPVISLHKSCVSGFEALVRWNHPSLGLVSPLSFIGIAEETGMIIPLGAFVLEEAVRQCLKWNEAHLQVEPISVSVNVSANQIKQIGFQEYVIGVLASVGLPPSYLKLEVTESTIATDTPEAINTLEGLKAHGIEIYMDDFGTGYSSFSYLDRLPIQVLKIDRSFVSVDDEAAIAKPDIVRAIISMAKTLGLDVTAEGVETIEQSQALAEMGCDNFQGYLFSKPMQASRTFAFIQNYIRPFRESIPQMGMK
jgi:diguanylate cyclase (GGDEF)-like protein/PAS domain S-box-containing protein